MVPRPPKPFPPPLLPSACPPQTDKVFIVTGGYSGIGLALSSMLFSLHGIVYIAGRSRTKADEAMRQIKAQHPASRGSLQFLSLDFGDLQSVRGAVDAFVQLEGERLDADGAEGKKVKLHVLYNNAGVMIPPQGSKTEQGYELQLGTNCLGPFLFTKLLKPALEGGVDTSSSASTSGSTSGLEPTGSSDAQPGEIARIVWVSSSASEGFAPPHGMDMSNLDYHVDKSAWEKYGISKTGNIFHAAEAARRWGGKGIVSVSLDPGNINTPLYQHMPWIIRILVQKFILYDVKYGAYTELYAGLSPDIGVGQNNGCFVKPFGKISTPRADILESCSGPDSLAAKFWDWSEEQVKEWV